MSDFSDVGAFHRKFELPSWPENDQPHGLDAALVKFRLKFLLEELAELASAYGLTIGTTVLGQVKLPEKQDLPRIADSLVDLVYVALGTAHMHGFPWPAIWAEVQRSNMTKERAKTDGSNSARGSSFDVVKPEGWKPPNVARILTELNWPCTVMGCPAMTNATLGGVRCAVHRHMGELV